MINDLLTFSLQNGLTQQTLLFLLLLPALGTLIIFFRIVIGLPLPLYRGLLLALGVHASGLTYGLSLFFIALALDLLIKKALEQKRFLLPAKHVFSLLVISLVVLILFITAGYFTKRDFLSLEVLPILVILVSTQGLFTLHPGDHPLRPLFWLFGMILLLSLSFVLLSSLEFHAFILSSPLIFLLILLGIILLLARFRGLRLVEFVRFFKVITNS